MKIKQILLAAVIISSINFATFATFANGKDGVLVLPDEPTKVQIQLVRNGAKAECQQDEEDTRAQCVVDYYAQHNLDEEPSCD